MSKMGVIILSGVVLRIKWDIEAICGQKALFPSWGHGSPSALSPSSFSIPGSEHPFSFAWALGH